MNDFARLNTESVRVEAPLFLLDSALGRLARYLRILGYDAVYMRDARASEVWRETIRTGRFLLTRTRTLAGKKNAVVYLVQSDEVLLQLGEVCRVFHLTVTSLLMSRCLDCNVPLVNVGREEVLVLLPSHVAKTQQDFARCPQCNKIYWPGTHYARAIRRVSEVIRQSTT